MHSLSEDIEIFKLDSTLEQDTVALGDTADYDIRLANDSRFPWVIVVPKVEMATELYHLTPAQQQQLALDSARLGSELMELFSGDSLNTGALGNVVRQLHIHHVVRYKTDQAWPGPVWGAGTAIRYSEQKLADRVKKLQQQLTIFR